MASLLLNAAEITALKAKLAALNSTIVAANADIAANAQTIVENQRDMDIAWLVICGEKRSRISGSYPRMHDFFHPGVPKPSLHGR